MIECFVFVAEVIAVLRDFYPIAVSVFIHPRQSSLCVRLPRATLIQLILRLRHLAQVLDAVVKPVAVDVVNLQRRKPPSPNRSSACWHSHACRVAASGSHPSLYLSQLAICISVEDNTFAADACLLFFLLIVLLF